MVDDAWGGNVVSQSAYLFTSVFPNQNAHNTIQNWREMTLIMFRIKDQVTGFLLWKNNFTENVVWQVVFTFTMQVFTFSRSRKIFRKFYCFPFRNISWSRRYLVLKLRQCPTIYFVGCHCTKQGECRVTYSQSFLTPSRML